MGYSGNICRYSKRFGCPYNKMRIWYYEIIDEEESSEATEIRKYSFSYYLNEE